MDNHSVTHFDIPLLCMWMHSRNVYQKTRSTGNIPRPQTCGFVPGNNQWAYQLCAYRTFYELNTIKTPGGHSPPCPVVSSAQQLQNLWKINHPSLPAYPSHETHFLDCHDLPLAWLQVLHRVTSSKSMSHFVSWSSKHHLLLHVHPMLLSSLLHPRTPHMQSFAPFRLDSADSLLELSANTSV